MHQLIQNPIKKILDSYSMRETISTFEPKINFTLRKSLRLMISGYREKNYFIIILGMEDFRDAICNDFFFNYKRIQNHKLNLNFLLNSEANKTHPAWIVVTAYYACYYMALDLNRLAGNFLITFQKDEMDSIFKEIRFDSHIPFKDSTHTSFQTSVRKTDNDEIEIKFSVASGKSHLLGWRYLRDNFFKSNKSNNGDSNQYLIEKQIISQILYGESKWLSPSQVRNKWNYQELNLYDDEGLNESKIFLKILKEDNYAYKWIHNRSLLPTSENHVASIAFLYQYLSHNIDKLYAQYFDNFTA